MRGEYRAGRVPKNRLSELPPRARRILLKRVRGWSMLGTTSACAENTLNCMVWTPRVWNYLRVRGEYGAMARVGATPLELPPRARRILCHAEDIMAAGGTTSACAENTSNSSISPLGRWNYLRVRGEYYIPVRDAPRISELPPRARRILIHV